MMMVLLARNPSNMGKQLKILQDIGSKMDMTINTIKMKVMILKSKKITHDTFVYENNELEVVPFEKYVGIDIHHKLS